MRRRRRSPGPARAVVLALASTAVALVGACQSATPPPAAETVTVPVAVQPTETTASSTSPTTTVSVTTPATTTATTGTAAGTATDTTVPPTAATVPPENLYRVGQQATFAHFTARVEQTLSTEAQGYLVRATVCVTSLPPNPSGDRTTVSWSPWTVQTRTGILRATLFDASHPPESLFPQSGLYAVHDCASGYIPFAKADQSVTQVAFRNEYGDQAVWVVGS